MKVLSFLILMSLFISGCTKGGGSGNVTPKNDEEKAFYALGAMLGSRFKDLDLSDNEISLVQGGLYDAARGTPQFEPTEHQAKIQEIFKTRMQKKTDKSKEAGLKYLEDFKKKEGVKVTASGLAYKVLKEGSGKKPKGTDTVEVHYHGTLIDGTVFDSSVERGKTVSFPLNRVIKGWTEGLQLISEGGKVQLAIPSELGYGDHGAPPKIPGGAALIFEVELFKVTKGAKDPHSGLRKKLKKEKGKKAKK